MWYLHFFSDYFPLLCGKVNSNCGREYCLLSCALRQPLYFIPTGCFLVYYSYYSCMFSGTERKRDLLRIVYLYLFTLQWIFSHYVQFLHLSYFYICSLCLQFLWQHIFAWLFFLMVKEANTPILPNGSSISFIRFTIW